MQVVKLPHGLYLDGKLFNMAEIRGITGREQNYLTNMELLKKGLHISKILASCVLSLSTSDGEKLETPVSSVVDKLLTTDRYFLMVQIRRESLGDKYVFQFKCRKCEKSTAYTQDLSELEVTYAKDPRMEYDIVLPTEQKAVVKLPNGLDEKKVYDIVKNHGDTLATSMIGLTLKTLNEKPVTSDDLMNLCVRDSNFITERLEEFSSGIDEKLQFECPDCGEQYEEPLPVGGIDFFIQPPKKKVSTGI